MHTHKPTSPRLHSTTPAAPADRRSRARLRDLCDEVLASFRAASSSDLISEADRVEGHAFLANIAPLAR